MNIPNLTAQINADIEKILRDNYVGVYFHGSLRLGSFNPHKSDLDFIIVAKKKLSPETKKQICDYTMENRSLFPKKGFEFSVILEQYCDGQTYPTPYELHMSGAWEEKYLADPSSVVNDTEKVDPDLASHFNVINQTNRALDFGKPSEQVFGIVPKEYVLKSNWEDIKNSEEDIFINPTYSILNLCRFYAYVKDGLTLSKYSGGEWALKNLPSWNSKIIATAMDDYMHDINPQYQENELRDFAKTAMKDIKAILANTISET